MKSMNYKAVLFDFNGVLCKDEFYKKTLLPAYQNVFDWIQKNVFAEKELVDKWMRGETDSEAINKFVAERTGIKQNKLQALYAESIRLMELDQDILGIALSIKKAGAKIGIVTDNMDVFSKIVVPNHRLDSLFDVIVNSADLGILKSEWKPFETALSELEMEVEDTLMVDDSKNTIELFKERGGSGFLYTNATELRNSLRI